MLERRRGVPSERVVGRGRAGLWVAKVLHIRRVWELRLFRQEGGCGDRERGEVGSV